MPRHFVFSTSPGIFLPVRSSLLSLPPFDYCVEAHSVCCIHLHQMHTYSGEEWSNRLRRHYRVTKLLDKQDKTEAMCKIVEISEFG